ncbi:hypothetical protein DAPPUDRAFT_233972 [Daphnia pulex]|uniref:Uncharacterized protein n=1 Tax=Daphnia pulex TaxID=6669 RepID=E9FW90_DAPPU|nr:hypothetical protein DAPPUDRAFT_233972 [Daphnia pulex]|eukprot:EFX88684.1 hypothetical protein DAPPUDRAFT_233972 [Daphnia pulex]
MAGQWTQQLREMDTLLNQQKANSIRMELLDTDGRPSSFCPGEAPAVDSQQPLAYTNHITCNTVERSLITLVTGHIEWLLRLLEEEEEKPSASGWIQKE